MSDTLERELAAMCATARKRNRTIRTLQKRCARRLATAQEWRDRATVAQSELAQAVKERDAAYDDARMMQERLQRLIDASRSNDARTEPGE